MALTKDEKIFLRECLEARMDDKYYIPKGGPLKQAHKRLLDAEVIYGTSGDGFWLAGEFDDNLDRLR